MKVTILGIAGSPRHGNTEILTKEALRGAEELSDVETKFITLAGKKIASCLSTYRCYDAAAAGRGDVNKPCVDVTDDADEIFRDMYKADGIIIGSPVYWGGVPAQLKALIDRTMGFEPLGYALRNKVGGVVVVAYDRQGGHEGTIKHIHTWMLMMDMLPVGIGPDRSAVKEKPKNYERGIGGYLGAMALDNLGPRVYAGAQPLDGVKSDRLGLSAARLLGKRVAEVAKVVKYGFEHLPKEELAWPRGPLK